ncbi:MAG: hypothetical protein GWN00_29640, partial [Aliifodinibius sp.]|nr:hypothetical protein [Fodinibius sp.]NIY28802.1 hypothetical protein [Fodinibius sp.]
GLGGDVTASDGIYSETYMNTNLTGYYLIRSDASGTYTSGPFTAELQKTLQVGPYGQISIAPNSLQPVPNSTIQDPHPTISATIIGPGANIDV